MTKPKTKTKKEKKDNGIMLRELLKKSGSTQQEALDLFNEGQAKPMALRTLKTYLAHPDSVTRVNCPDVVLVRMKELLLPA